MARLFGEPYRFDFFQLVRLLELWARDDHARNPRRPCKPVGRAALPEEEAVRFRGAPGLTFPGSAVATVRGAAAPGRKLDPPVEVLVHFLGLIGSNGVLPHHYTSLLLERIRARDNSLRDWLDVFQHRFVSHFYQAWEKYRLPFAYERWHRDPAGAEDGITAGVYALVGLGTGGLRRRLTVPDSAFLYYAGQFAHQPRNALSLEGLLVDYFGLPMEVRTLQGQWLNLGDGDLARMPGHGKPGRNNRPGKNLIVGKRIWDVQSKFRIRVGPLTYAQFRDLMPVPRGGRLRPLWQLTRTYAGPELDFDVQPVLKAAEVPRCQLSKTGARPQLGWNTWVRSKPMPRDVDDAVFKLREL